MLTVIFCLLTTLRERPFDFYLGGGGGKITLVLEMFYSNTGAWLFCIVWSWVFFSQDYVYKTKQKQYYISADNDLEIVLSKFVKMRYRIKKSFVVKKYAILILSNNIKEVIISLNSHWSSVCSLCFCVKPHLFINAVLEDCSYGHIAAISSWA